MAPHAPDKRVEIKIEVGHQATCRETKSPNDHFTHDWTVFVRGAEGADISHFVDKVIFYLHESFHKPKRVRKEPPYSVTEKGYGSFTLPLEIYFRQKEEPRKYRLEYDLSLQIVGMPPLNITKVDKLTFLNPSEDFERKLISGGGIVLSPLSSPTNPPLVKTEGGLSRVSPASSHGSSPGSTKRHHTSTKPTKSSNSNQSTPQQVNHTKRSSYEENSIQKSKKKKTESTDHTPNQKHLKEIPLLSSSNEIDSKPKINHYTKKIKDRRKSTETSNTSTSPKNSHSKDHSKIKGKEMKIKNEKKRSPNNNTHDDQPPKLQSLKIKRLADDAWSSINTTQVTTNHNNNLISKDYNLTKDAANTLHKENTSKETSANITSSFKQNERVSALFEEFANEESESDGEDLHSPFSYEQKSSFGNVFSNLSNEFNGVIDDVKHHNNNNIDLVKTKKIKQHKNQPLQNGSTHATLQVKEDTVKKSSEVMDTKHATSNGLPNGITLAGTTTDLYDIYDKLNNSQDTELLQKVVDIVEETGLFEVTSSTFDFDLKSLDDEVIYKIKECLEIV